MRVNSLADLPEAIRAKVAGKVIEQKKSSKYHNEKTVVNGITFDSVKEASRYSQLKIALDAGVIEDLRLQEEFTLQEGYTTPEGEKIRPIRYRADFTYKRNGVKVIEDVKGLKTDVYKLKAKWMRSKGYIITEV